MNRAHSATEPFFFVFGELPLDKMSGRQKRFALRKTGLILLHCDRTIKILKVWKIFFSIKYLDEIFDDQKVFQVFR